MSVAYNIIEVMIMIVNNVMDARKFIKLCFRPRRSLFLTIMKKYLWKAKGVPQENHASYPNYPEEKKTSLNRNHVFK